MIFYFISRIKAKGFIDEYFEISKVLINEWNDLLKVGKIKNLYDKICL